MQEYIYIAGPRILKKICWVTIYVMCLFDTKNINSAISDLETNLLISMELLQIYFWKLVKY